VRACFNIHIKLSALMYLSVFQSRSRSHRLSYHVALKFHKGFDGVNKMHVLHQEIARHARFVQVPTTKSFLNTTLNPQTPAEIQSVDLPTIRNTEIDISSPNPPNMRDVIYERRDSRFSFLPSSTSSPTFGALYRYNDAAKYPRRTHEQPSNKLG
jgi:hypothetical protein